jgi:hypothetical protein
MAPKTPKKQQGVFKPAPNTGDPPERVADFSYQNDALAEMIVKAWTDSTFYDGLILGTPAQRSTFARAALRERGINLTYPIVLKEQEFDDGWDRDDPNEVVFVLPKRSRATQGTPLLETAKLLMGCTPNGI